MNQPRVESSTGPERPEPSRLFTVVGLAAALIMVAYVLRRASEPLFDSDVWFHLRVGSDILDGGSITNPEPLTPFATSDWYPRSWLPQVVFAQLERWFGLPGIAWVYGATMVVLILVVYFVARRHASPMPAGLVTLLATVGCLRSLTPRPQVLSFILVALFTAAWLRTVDDLRPPWWLIPATWVWAMSHGMWPVGVALGLGVIMGLALDGRLDRSSGWRFAAVPIGSLVAAALTIQGPRLLWSSPESAAFFDYIPEYLPPALNHPHYVAVLVLIGTVVVSSVRRTTQLSWARIAILLQAVFWTLYTIRSLPLGAVMAAPLAAAAIQSLLPGPVPARRRSETVTLTTAAVVGLLALALVVPGTATEPGRMPSALNEQLQALPAGTPVLNEYGLGSWIEWRHRHLAPVIDGLTYQFGIEEMRAHDDAMNVQPGWEDYVDSTGADAALLADDVPLAVALQDHLGWQQLGQDAGFVLLRPPEAE